MKKLVMLKLVIFVNIASINKLIIFNTKIIVAYFISLNTLIVVNVSTMQISLSQKRVISNNITIFDNFSTYNRLFTIIEAYSNI